ncbi:MAG: DUF432 domain-containing protein [Pseudomonadota bacterium]
MFDTYDIPIRIENNGIAIDIQKDNGHILYKRSCPDESVEKRILSDCSSILINPVEPLNKPKELTPYFLVEFVRPIVVEPKATHIIYLTFPIETGVFICKNSEFQNLDILTLARKKYTLYGDPLSGMLCRFWQSAVHHCIPSANPLCEGIMELAIINATTAWSEVTKAVFTAHGMKIYYNKTMVSMKATMKISGTTSAETAFDDAPLVQGMKKSLELYTARKLLVISPKFFMLEGI